MEKKNRKISYLNNSCKCCLKNRHILEDLWGEKSVEGDGWVYGEMISKCFAISWQKPVDRAELICESCIKRLLIAFKFKKDVLASERILMEQMEGTTKNCLFNDEDNECNEIVKGEVIIDDDIIQEDLIPDEDSEEKAVSDHLEHFEEAIIEDNKKEQEYFKYFIGHNINAEPVKQEKDEDNECNEIVKEEVMIDDNVFQEDLIPDEASEEKAVSDNLEHFEEVVIKDNKKGQEYFKYFFEHNINVEPVKQEKDQTNFPQEQENEIENCSAKNIKNCLKAITSNKLVPVLVLDRYLPKKVELLKQRKTADTNILQNQEVIKTDSSSHSTRTHEDEGELKEITSEFNSNTLFEEKDVTASSSALKRASPCALCGQHVSSSSSPTQHKCARAADTPSCDIEERGEQAATKFTCDVCKRDFKLKRSLTRHILDIHKYTNKSNILYTCNICNKQFLRKFFLTRHQRTHTGEKPYSCTLCNKQFSHSHDLTRHQRIHTGEKPYSCEFCNKQFSDSSSLVHHRRHTGEKPYSCKVCNINFSYSSNLIRHQRIHTGEKPYSCKVCNKQFRDSSNLASHQRIHTGEKSYSCKVCNKQFLHNKQLSRHKQTDHISDKPTA